MKCVGLDEERCMEHEVNSSNPDRGHVQILILIFGMLIFSICDRY